MTDRSPIIHADPAARTASRRRGWLLAVALVMGALGVFAFGDHRGGDHSTVVGMIGPGHAVSVDGSEPRADDDRSAPVQPEWPAPAEVVTAVPGGDPLRLNPGPAAAWLLLAALVLTTTGIAATAPTVTGYPARAARRRTRSSTTLLCVARA